MIEIKNPKIILMPITESEKNQIISENPTNDESIYVLYNLPDEGKIQIGMMGTTVATRFPELANISRLEEATSKTYFYNGTSDLEKIASLLDRPVYRVLSNDNRTVSTYEIINATDENGLNVSLEELIKNDIPKTKVFK